MDKGLSGPLRKGTDLIGPDPNLFDPNFVFSTVTAPQIFATQRQKALAWMSNNQADVVIKKFPPPDGPDHQLVYINGDIYWKTAPVVAVVVAPEDPLEAGPAYVNTGFEWLTYETVLNKPKFRKTNQPRKIGLYAADVSDMQVWVRDLMPVGSLPALCNAFFPDHQVGEVQLLSDGSWWWKQQPDLATMVNQTAPYAKVVGFANPPDEIFPALGAESQEALTGSRNGLRIHLPRSVVMPYNFYDNDTDSNALGTLPMAEDLDGAIKHPIPLIQVKTDPNDAQSWDVWRTASRSSVMKLNSVKDPGDPWPPNDWVYWKFPSEAERKKFESKSANINFPPYLNTAYKQEVALPARFRHSTRTANHFSVKTGVCYVGSEKQSGANKDVIGKDDEWMVGCMRSDTIKAMDELVKIKNPDRVEDIVIQTEIMMVLERKASPAMTRFGVDGVALRDLTVLDPDKFYVPPLSIPFIANDMMTVTEEFANIDDPAWCSFWQTNWAEAIGRAKALFLVQYGMQHANPNVQNSLLEFDALPVPAGPVRVIIRDVADALLVREVAWALFGEDRACPQDTDAHADLMNMSLPVLRYNFRSEAQAHENETGAPNEQFGEPGIQFLWQRFSAFYGVQKGDKILECPVARRHKALQLMCTWLVAHSAAYVRTVEKALGKEFGEIAWHDLLSPDHAPGRFQAGQSLNDWATPAKADLAWEETAAEVLQVYFRDAGRANICAYHNRGWVDATPAFVVKVADAMAAPMPLTVVYYASHDGTMTGQRITDPKGEVPFYSQTFDDFDFDIGRGDYVGATGAWTRAKVRLGSTGNVGNVTTVTPPLPTPPVVTVTDPGVPVSGTAVAVTATATPDIGLTIASVQFSIDGNAFGAPAAASPYTATLDTTTLANGPHQLTAVATDSLGATTTSAAVQVTVNNPAPTVSVTAPADGATISGTGVALTADAAAGAGMTLANVVFQVDGGAIATVGAPGPYAATLDTSALTPGAHAITALAADTVGNTTTSAQVTVTVA